jgi:hypothetical protein
VQQIAPGLERFFPLCANKGLHVVHRPVTVRRARTPLRDVGDASRDRPGGDVALDW